MNIIGLSLTSPQFRSHVLAAGDANAQLNKLSGYDVYVLNIPRAVLIPLTANCFGDFLNSGMAGRSAEMVQALLNVLLSYADEMISEASAGAGDGGFASVIEAFVEVVLRPGAVETVEARRGIGRVERRVRADWTSDDVTAYRLHLFAARGDGRRDVATCVGDAIGVSQSGKSELIEASIRQRKSVAGANDGADTAAAGGRGGRGTQSEASMRDKAMRLSKRHYGAIGTVNNWKEYAALHRALRLDAANPRHQSTEVADVVLNPQSPFHASRVFSQARAMWSADACDEQVTLAAYTSIENNGTRVYDFPFHALVIRIPNPFLNPRDFYTLMLPDLHFDASCMTELDNVAPMMGVRTSAAHAYGGDNDDDFAPPTEDALRASVVGFRGHSVHSGLMAFVPQAGAAGGGAMGSGMTAGNEYSDRIAGEVSHVTHTDVYHYVAQIFGAMDTRHAARLAEGLADGALDAFVTPDAETAALVRAHRLAKVALFRVAYSMNSVMSSSNRGLIVWGERRIGNAALNPHRNFSRPQARIAANLSLAGNVVVSDMLQMEFDYDVLSAHQLGLLLVMSARSVHDQSDQLKIHMLFEGIYGSGKSFVMELVAHNYCVPGTSETLTGETAKSFTGESSRNDLIVIKEEMQPDELGIDAVRGCANAASSERESMTKDVLTRKEYSYSALTFVERDGRSERETQKFTIPANMAIWGIINNAGHAIKPALKSRFLLVSQKMPSRKDKRLMDVVAKNCLRRNAETSQTIADNYCEQYLHCLVRKLEYTGVYAEPVDMTLAHVFYKHVLATYEARGYHTESIRAYERMLMAAQVHTIRVALHVLFDSELAVYRDTPFAIAQLLDLEPGLVCTEDTAIYTGGLMSLDYVNPNDAIVLRTILRNNLERKVTRAAGGGTPTYTFVHPTRAAPPRNGAYNAGGQNQNQGQGAIEGGGDIVALGGGQGHGQNGQGGGSDESNMDSSGRQVYERDYYLVSDRYLDQFCKTLATSIKGETFSHETLQLVLTSLAGTRLRVNDGRDRIPAVQVHPGRKEIWFACELFAQRMPRSLRMMLRGDGPGARPAADSDEARAEALEDVHPFLQALSTYCYPHTRERTVITGLVDAARPYIMQTFHMAPNRAPDAAPQMYNRAEFVNESMREVISASRARLDASGDDNQLSLDALDDIVTQIEVDSDIEVAVFQQKCNRIGVAADYVNIFIPADQDAYIDALDANRARSLYPDVCIDMVTHQQTRRKRKAATRTMSSLMADTNLRRPRLGDMVRDAQRGADAAAALAGTGAPSPLAVARTIRGAAAAARSSTVTPVHTPRGGGGPGDIVDDDDDNGGARALSRAYVGSGGIGDSVARAERADETAALESVFSGLDASMNTTTTTTTTADASGGGDEVDADAFRNLMEAFDDDDYGGSGDYGGDGNGDYGGGNGSDV
jgi:hypothetical protein